MKRTDKNSLSLKLSNDLMNEISNFRYYYKNISDNSDQFTNRLDSFNISISNKSWDSLMNEEDNDNKSILSFRTINEDVDFGFKNNKLKKFLYLKKRPYVTNSTPLSKKNSILK